MSVIQAVLDKNIRLFDYEAITKDVEDATTGKVKKQRIVAFGKYAGLAGMIDTFQCLGRRLLASGHSTPFLNCSPAYVYYDLDEAKRCVKEMGEHIKSEGLPSDLALVFVFTGKGNVTKGALEIFKLIPHKMITLEEAKEIKKTPGPHHCVYGVMVEQEDIVRRKSSFPKEPFDVKHYRENPSEYESTFASNVAPFTNVIVNGIYWDERYPRLLSKEQITDLWKRGHKRYVFRFTLPPSFVLSSLIIIFQCAAFLQSVIFLVMLGGPLSSWNIRLRLISHSSLGTLSRMKRLMKLLVMELL